MEYGCTHIAYIQGHHKYDEEWKEPTQIGRQCNESSLFTPVAIAMQQETSEYGNARHNKDQRINCHYL